MELCRPTRKKAVAIPDGVRAMVGVCSWVRTYTKAFLWQKDSSDQRPVSHYFSLARRSKEKKRIWGEDM